MTDSIDMAQQREHFALPPSIVLGEAGSIWDWVNRVTIYYNQPTEPLRFDSTEPAR